MRLSLLCGKQQIKNKIMPTKLKSLKKNKRETVSLLRLGESVKGVIEAIDRNAVFIDLGPQGIGVIYGREFYGAKEALKKLKVGDEIRAKVINLENNEGYRELSITEALRENAWKKMTEMRNSGEGFDVRVEKVNKGGLICYIKNIPAFLPVSYLAPEHYPRIKNGDTNQIARMLQKFVGQKLRVKVIDLDQKRDKLILAEKQEAAEKKEEELKKYKVGDIVKGKITGLTNFGAFVGIGKNIEGLLYPSDEPKNKKEKAGTELKIGEEIKAKITKVENGRFYLSLEV